MPIKKIIFILFLLPVHLFAQQVPLSNRDITGLWKGSLYNDTTKKNLPYEIAISEEKGKLSGYSYTLFDIDGKKELGVKRIKIKIKNDHLIIEDVELISNNYSAPPPRKVRQQSVVNLLVNDTAIQLTGKWSTNQTREYSSLTGSLQLKRALDFRLLALFEKLVELKLDQDLSFVQADNRRNADMAEKEKPTMEIKLSAAVPSRFADADKPEENSAPEPGKKIIAAIAMNEPIKKENKPSAQIVKDVVINKPKEITSTGAEKKTKALIVKDSISIKPKPAAGLVKKPVDKPKTIAALEKEKKKEVIVAANDMRKVNNQPVVINPKTIIPLPVIKKPEPLATTKEQPKRENKSSVAIVMQEVTNDRPKAIVAPVVNNKMPIAAVKETVKTESKTTSVIITPPEQKKEIPFAVATPIIAAAADVLERKMDKEQSVFFESDSLVLTLYDNGEVDGDTVSVLMNGQIIFARQGLSTKANSKTIYIAKGVTDSLSLVMYAENLGSIPPNTGLMIIMDGEKRYEVRFSADLKTNAAILLRRKPKEK